MSALVITVRLCLTFVSCLLVFSGADPVNPECNPCNDNKLDELKKDMESRFASIENQYLELSSRVEALEKQVAEMNKDVGTTTVPPKVSTTTKEPVNDGMSEGPESTECYTDAPDSSGEPHNDEIGGVYPGFPEAWIDGNETLTTDSGHQLTTPSPVSSELKNTKLICEGNKPISVTRSPDYIFASCGGTPSSILIYNATTFEKIGHNDSLFQDSDCTIADITYGVDYENYQRLYLVCITTAPEESTGYKAQLKVMYLARKNGLIWSSLATVYTYNYTIDSRDSRITMSTVKFSSKPTTILTVYNSELCTVEPEKDLKVTYTTYNESSPLLQVQKPRNVFQFLVYESSFVQLINGPTIVNSWQMSSFDATYSSLYRVQISQTTSLVGLATIHKDNSLKLVGLGYANPVEVMRWTPPTGFSAISDTRFCIYGTQIIFVGRNGTQGYMSIYNVIIDPGTN